MKKKLFKEGIKTKICEICNITEWQNAELSFELDHKNGDNLDHRIENLRILCPNCHSQTPNYRGRKKKNSSISEYRKDNYLEALNSSNGKIERLVETPKEVKVRVRVKKDKTFKICPQCLLEFQPTQSKKSKYCSVLCYRMDSRSNFPPKDELLKSFEELESFVQVGKRYNVSDNAVRKWCRAYGILQERLNKNYMLA